MKPVCFGVARYFGLTGLLVASSMALAQPSIVTQPQSQTVVAGTDVVFSVVVAGGSGSAVLPAVSSGTLRLWLKADAGVITNASGHVSQWQDQSGNANHASQANAVQQPSLVFPPAINGRRAVRFDGVQDNVTGDYLQGTGDVGIPDAFTAFMVYYIQNDTNEQNTMWFVGVPDTYGSCRDDSIINGAMLFGTWTYDYYPGLVIPTNTYRLWTDRMNTNRDSVDVFDSTATVSNNFTFATSGQSAPGAGYYVGGMDPSAAFASIGRNFAGDIAELIFYRGALTESDRVAVENYLRQKYYQPSSQGGPVAYQWQLDQTNILDATNSTLVLNNVQITDSGIYSVILSNSAGLAISSNATLLVGLPPNIISQPLSEEAAQGTNISFTVSASGTAPLSFQWYYKGQTLAQATNSVLNLSNVQPSNAGTYFVVVSSPFGSVTSSNAQLTVDPLPVILTQPQGQTVIVGTNVTFSVVASGSATAGILPSVNSGSLRLWLKADAGVVTNGAGQVSQWQDQSGNALHCSQSNPAQQPLLEFPPAIGGRAALRFDGIQDGVHGDFLQGTGDVGISGAFTSFQVYGVLSATNAANAVVLVGVPGNSGAVRGNDITDGNMRFTLWNYDYSFPVTVPLNTYRIWTDRVNSNVTTLEAFDRSSTSATNFTANLSGAQPVGAGYYVGGLTINYAFNGDIAELIYYQGSLTDSDRLAVESYLRQKYFQPAVPGAFTYQWQVNGTNISGATNATLMLTNVQIADTGIYTVLVGNSAGSVSSSNAVLTVGVPPSISAQPQSQEVVQGTNVTFSATAAGTLPLGYQWYFNGVALSQATNSVLSLSGVQTTNVGNYSVSVNNAFGSVLSSNAQLSIDLMPAILVQPQSQSVVLGNNVTFNVAAAGSAASATLPAVGSGSLRLWLKADAGVVTNAAGRVSQWRDQSGNTNNCSQSNTNQQPLLVFPPAINGRAALRFDGIQDNVHGDYLQSTGSVGIPDAFTAFMLYYVKNDAPLENTMWFVGSPGTYGAGRDDSIVNGKMLFGTWTYDYSTGFLLPTNTYRIWTDRMNTNRNLAEVFDSTATSATNFIFAASGQSAPASGYFVGGFSAITSSRCFNGDLAELIFYRGSLSDLDRLAVESYLKQKYYQTGSAAGVTFQWSVNGANIDGATNSSLLLTNVQTADAGNYSVIVSNAVGSVTSSNAVLTVNVPPSFTLQPQSQAVNVGGSVTFNVAASGTPTISYQWRFQGTNIAGATNASLTLSNLQTSDAGNYQVVATSPYGSVLCSNATLTVSVSSLTGANVSGTGGGLVTFPIQLAALGTENTLGFSLNFDPALLTFVGAALGTNGGDGFLQTNTFFLSSGKLGLAVGLPTAETFPAGMLEVVVVTFQMATVTNAVTTPVAFSDQPVARVIADAIAAPLLAAYANGSVAIAVPDYEGDAAPRPGGNHVLDITDWVQVGRYVAGLDAISSLAEFARIDCAPRSTLGNGEITVIDWVQAGRYAIGLDPLTAAGGSTGPTPQHLKAGLGRRGGANPLVLGRIIRVSPVTQAGATNVVAVQLVAQGGENALGSSLSFDPAVLRFASATLGGNAHGALLDVNTNQAATGKLGLAIALPINTSFAAGTQELVRLTFTGVSYSSNETALAFGDTPVPRELADVTANVLTASYQDGIVGIAALQPALSISFNGGNVLIAWPLGATNFMLESSSPLGTNWAGVNALFQTNGQSVSLTVPVSSNAQYFRLRQP